MGILKITDLIKSKCKDSIKSIKINKYSGKKVAIDASMVYILISN
jgi:hypothetical protein